MDPALAGMLASWALSAWLWWSLEGASARADKAEKLAEKNRQDYRAVLARLEELESRR